MGKFAKKKTEKTKKLPLWIVIVCAAAAVAIVVAAAFFLGGEKPGEKPEETLPTSPTQQTEQTQATEEVPEQTQAPSMKLLTVESTQQQGQTVVVTTSYCVVQYPFAFSDLIVITAVNQEDMAELNFGARLNGAEYPLFTVSFGGEGIPLGTLTLEGALPQVPVSVQIHEIDPNLDEEYTSSFFAAQEIINDVLASLAENGNFTPAG